MALLVAIVSTVLPTARAMAIDDDELLEAGRTTTMEFILDRAISRGLISGAVVVVGNSRGIVHTVARGRVNAQPEAPPLNEHTVFDVASLTKVLATMPAVMKLLEDGRISLLDPLSRFFPEVAGSGLEEVTLLNLLTHSSGLSDLAIEQDSLMPTVLRKLALQKNRRLPGSNFAYADINFILLGEVVRRVSGRPLDLFCRETVYGPLGLENTAFLPMGVINAPIAATMGGGGVFTTGIVQDENARRLGGVAGHAGLFSSARDLAGFSAMMLSGGMVDGKRIFDERSIAQMTAPYYLNDGRVVRGLGWDIASPYSSPKGRSFSRMSFGHTGYSGSSIWLDPQADLYVILLTNRLDYSSKRMINRLRSDISNLAMAAFGPPEQPAVGTMLAAAP